MSFKRLKRRLSLTFRGRPIDESLSELAEHMTVEENGIVKENGKCLNNMSLSQNFDFTVLKPAASFLGMQKKNLTCLEFTSNVTQWINHVWKMFIPGAV